jgi:hypothetical protein
MISRRVFLGRVAAALVAAKLALSGQARAAVAAPAPEKVFQGLTPQENLRRLYLAYLHAQGQNSRRYEVNMNIVKAAHRLITRDGFSTAQVQRMTHEARLQAKRDFGTEADTYLTVRARAGFRPL